MVGVKILWYNITVMKKVVLAVLGLVVSAAPAAVLENAELAIELDDASFAVRSRTKWKAGVSGERSRQAKSRVRR